MVSSSPIPWSVDTLAAMTSIPRTTVWRINQNWNDDKFLMNQLIHTPQYQKLLARGASAKKIKNFLNVENFYREIGIRKEE